VVTCRADPGKSSRSPPTLKGGNSRHRARFVGTFDKAALHHLMRRISAPFNAWGKSSAAEFAALNLLPNRPRIVPTGDPRAIDSQYLRRGVGTMRFRLPERRAALFLCALPAGRRAECSGLRALLLLRDAGCERGANSFFFAFMNERMRAASLNALAPVFGDGCPRNVLSFCRPRCHADRLGNDRPPPFATARRPSCLSCCAPSRATKAPPGPLGDDAGPWRSRSCRVRFGPEWVRQESCTE